MQLVFCWRAAAGSGVTQSASDEWSRGVIIGATEADPVSLATWEGTTFVTWIAESGHLQLAQLDAALTLQSVTDLALTAVYPYDVMLLEAESADRLHVVWLDSIDGTRTIIHARLTPGETEPAFRQEIRLPDEIEYVQLAMRLDAQRLEVFWSADENDDSGIYHQAISLMGGESPPVQLTQTGWQPAAGWGASGEMLFAWLEAGELGYYAVWNADFDPESQTLVDAAPVTQVRAKRWRHFLGPALGSAGGQNVMAWTIGWRTSVGRGQSYNAPGSTAGDYQMAVGLSQAHGAATDITSDKGQYVLTSAANQGTDAPIYSLTRGQVAEIWDAPRARTVGDRTWTFFSAWVVRRSEVRMQLVLVPFDENGAGEPVIVTKTRYASVWPDLAVSAGGTLRAVWVEPLGGDVFRVVAASTTPEARAALGGLRFAEWGSDVATLVFEHVSLLGYTPYVIGWALLPLGLLLVAMFFNSGGVRGWKAAAWLGMAVVLQLVCKRFFAPRMLPFELGIEGIALALAPVALGVVLMWGYWRRAQAPLLLAAYGLFVGADAAFSIFVMIPRLMCGV